VRTWAVRGLESAAAGSAADVIGSVEPKEKLRHNDPIDFVSECLRQNSFGVSDRSNFS
jgi:hypothetical protein